MVKIKTNRLLSEKFQKFQQLTSAAKDDLFTRRSKFTPDAINRQD
jgi:hypothetical protein